MVCISNAAFAKDTLLLGHSQLFWRCNSFFRFFLVGFGSGMEYIFRVEGTRKFLDDHKKLLKRFFSFGFGMDPIDLLSRMHEP